MAKKKEEKTNSEKLRDKWIGRIEAEEKAHSKARERSQKVIDRYRDEDRTKKSGARMNILWANTSVLKSALYSATPKPDVRRRFLDADPVSREAASAIERALAFSVDAYDFDGVVSSALSDYLLPGYANVRVRYKPYFNKEGEQDVLAYEEVTCEEIPWDMFRWDHTATRWKDVNWCCIDHYFDRQSLREKFPDVADDIELLHGPKNGTKGEDEKSFALIHEIFDKRTRKIIAVSDGYKKGPVKIWDDPLNLTGFYPFPKPLFATQTSGELMPIPDFLFYQDQASELDLVTERLDKLTDMLKVRGVYDGSFQELVNVLKSDDGDLTPVKDFSVRFPNGQDLESVIAFMPLEEVAKVVAALQLQREALKQTIYEITGISDIVRGQSDASETLGAQELKGRFADMRLSTRKSAVNAFLRDIFRIKAEIISEQFSPDTLKLMTGVEITPEIQQILKSDVLRAYKIDVETDSTNAVDAAEEQKSRVDALGGLTTFLQAAVPAVQSNLIPPELAKELGLFLVRGFKKAKPLEDIIERLGSQDGQGGEQQKLMQAQQQIQQLTEQLQQSQMMIEQGGQELQKLQAEHSDMKNTVQQKDLEGQQKDIEHSRQMMEKDGQIQAMNSQLREAKIKNFESSAVHKIKESVMSIKKSEEGEERDPLQEYMEVMDGSQKETDQRLSAIEEWIKHAQEGITKLIEQVEAQKPSPTIDVVKGKDGKIVSVNGRTVNRRMLN